MNKKVLLGCIWCLTGSHFDLFLTSPTNIINKWRQCTCKDKNSPGQMSDSNLDTTCKRKQIWRLLTEIKPRWRVLSWKNTAASPLDVSNYTAVWRRASILYMKNIWTRLFLSTLIGTLWGHVGNFVIVRLYGVPKNMPGISINQAFREKIRFGANTFHVPYSGAIVRSLFVTLERWKKLIPLQKSGREISLLSSQYQSLKHWLRRPHILLRPYACSRPLTAPFAGGIFGPATFTSRGDPDKY